MKEIKTYYGPLTLVVDHALMPYHVGIFFRDGNGNVHLQQNKDEDLGGKRK